MKEILDNVCVVNSKIYDAFGSVPPKLVNKVSLVQSAQSVSCTMHDFKELPWDFQLVKAAGNSS